MTTIEQIQRIISTESAYEYAQKMIDIEKYNCELIEINTQTGIVTKKPVDYYEYMKQTWSGKDNPTLDECIKASNMSKLNEYADMIKKYTGFIKNGELFVLNKKEKFISFIYDVKRNGYGDIAPVERVKMYVNYNPLDVDYIEESINPKYFTNMLNDEYFEISKDINSLIKECDILAQC